MQKDKSILVIGGNGFLGSNIIKKANTLGWTTTNLSLNSDKKKLSDIFIQADIGEYEDLKSLIEEKSFNYVVNCGGYVDHSSFFDGGRDIIKTHLNGVFNLINLIKKDSLEKFINIGSSDEYGLKPSPQNESYREDPCSAYSFAKTASTHFLQMIYKTEEIPTTTLRLFLVYGPGQKSNRFIPQIINGCLNKDSFDTSKGEQIRNFCYIDDVVEAIFKTLDVKSSNGQIFNIGASESIKIKDLVNLIKDIVGTGSPRFGNIHYRKHENMSLFPDIKLAKDILDWESKVSLEEGIYRTIRFFQK